MLAEVRYSSSCKLAMIRKGQGKGFINSERIFEKVLGIVEG